MNFKDTALGIEFGTTRIKAVLIDRDHKPVAGGSEVWETAVVNGVWTYSEEDLRKGVQACFADLKRDVKEKYGETLKTVGAIGISAQMHGYFAFDKDDRPIAEFRTWRNTMTKEAAARLSELFQYNIPQRWSCAHLYQAILNKEPRVDEIKRLTTLGGTVNYILTGRHAMGIGEADGMFPVDMDTFRYDAEKLALFDSLHEMPWKVKDLLPEVLVAGECVGYLTEAGARYLDPEGDLAAGIPVAPCEGDAQTGMVATNSLRPGTGNVSAGTSAFSLIVTDHIPPFHREMGNMMTPTGKPVAQVHQATCTPDLNAWMELFGEFAETMGMELDQHTLFDTMFKKAMEGDTDCGGLMSFNCVAGEDVMNLAEGRPIFIRKPGAKMSLSNFMRNLLYSSLCTMAVGLRILKSENVEIKSLCGHGGFFKTPGVGQRILSAAVGSPVSVMETAGEGGPYGMALLAAFMLWKKDGETLEDYCDAVFRDAKTITVEATEEEKAGFARYFESYIKAFDIEKKAVEVF